MDRQLLVAGIALMSLPLLVACGPENGKEGQIKLAMGKSISTLKFVADDGPASVYPDYYGVKVLGASLRYVADPTDTNAAPDYESGFYVAPTGCSNGGKTKTERDGKEYEYYQPPGPDACNVTEMQFIDFAQDITTVNSEINASHYPVLPGAYNQVSICFSAVYGLRVDAHMSSIAEIDTSSDNTTPFGCMNTALDNFEIGEGEYATVSLTYDLSEHAVYTYDYGSHGQTAPNTCVESEVTSGVYVCVNGINPVPSAVKE